MDILLVLVYFSLFRETVSVGYFVSNTTALWAERNVECKIATPLIEYDAPVLYAPLDQSIQQDVWVGYYERSAVFDYIGCMNVKNNQHLPQPIKLGASTPGRCYSACAYTKYIGIKEFECYCFDNKPDGNTTELKCVIPCSDGRTLCGGMDHLSLYQRSTNSQNYSDAGLVLNTRGDDLCLQVHFQNDKNFTLKWMDCEKRIWTLCRKETPQTVRVRLWKEIKSWKEAAHLCFGKTSFPTRLEDINLVTYEKFFSWTGVVSSNIINKESVPHADSFDNIMFGYLKYDDVISGYVLMFADKDARKHVLCENERKATSSIETSTISEVTVVPESATGRNDNIDKNKEQQGKDFIVLVSVAISLVVLIACVVIISILVRRKKIPLLCKRKAVSGEQSPQYSETHNSKKNNGQEPIDVADVKISINSGIDHMYHVPEERMNNSNSDETTYDTTDDTEQKREDIENDIVYNKLNTENDGTYDHTDNTKWKRLDVCDQVYDNTGRAVTESNANINEYSDKRHGSDENTYNHLSNNKLQKMKTDNLYGVQGQEISAFGDLGDAGSGDMYSHTSNKIQSGYNQDNLYSKLTPNFEER